MRQFIMAAVAALVVCCAGEAKAQSTTVAVCGTLPLTYPVGAVRNPTVDVNGNACISGSITATAVTVATATAAAPAYSEGQVAPLSQNLSGAIRVIASIDTTGLATSAGQTTGNNSLSSIDTKSTALATILTNTGSINTAIAAVTGTKNAGTAAVSALLAAGVYNSTPLTLTNTQQASLQLDNNGYLKVNTAAGGGSGGTSSTFGATMPTTGTAIGLYDGTNMVRAKGDETSGIWVNIKAGAGSGGTALADEAAFTQGTTNTTPAGCLFTSSVTNLTSGQAGVVRCTNDRQLLVSDAALLTSVGAVGDTAWVSGNGSVIAVLKGIAGSVTGSTPAGTNTIGTVGQLPYPVGATPLTASATGTTAATTATLAGTSGKTTYLCSYSIRANATAATTVTNTITGVITATLSHIMWVAPAASGLGVDEQIFNPCVPASGTNQAIAVVSGAPGTGGLVSATATGYQL